jgi:hypothetical protein
MHKRKIFYGFVNSVGFAFVIKERELMCFLHQKFKHIISAFQHCAVYGTPLTKNNGLLCLRIGKVQSIAPQNILVGWWVGFGCGWAKLNVLQKRWLVCRLAALLILRRVGILSVVLQTANKLLITFSS